MVSNTARYQGQIYMVHSEQGDRVTLRHPRAITPFEQVNVGTNFMPILLPGFVSLPKRDVDLLKSESVHPLPPVPSAGDLAVGARFRWGTSLAEWVILSIDGDVAKARQVSGWNQAMVFDVPLVEVSLLERKPSLN